MISADSSSSVDIKESEESSDEEVYVKRKHIYHSDSEDSDEPSQPVLRRRPPLSSGETARGRGRSVHGKTRGSKKSRGGGSGCQSGGRVCSEQKYPHSVPKEAIALKLRTRSLRIRHHFILSSKLDLMYLMAVRPPLTISSFFLMLM